MRVTFLTSKLNFASGGGSNFDRHNKAAALVRLGCEVKVVTIFSQNNKIFEKVPYQVLAEEVPYNNYFQFHGRVQALLRKYEAETDIYYIDGHLCLFGAGLYRQKGLRPVIAHFDNYAPTVFNMGRAWPAKIKLVAEKYFEKICLLTWYNALDLYTFSSPIIEGIYHDFGVGQGRSLVLPEFIDFNDFKTSEPFACRSGADKFHLLYMGRLIREKGLDVLLRAVQLLENKDIILDIIGSGAAEKYFVSLSQQLLIADRLNWYPWLDFRSVGGAYRHAQVFVFPSLWPEPFGIIAVEAMLCGVPVIAASDTGPAWIVGENAGLIFKNGDFNDLAKKIKNVCEDQALRQELIKNGRERAESFRYEKFVDVLYRKMLALVAASRPSLKHGD